MTAPRTRLRDRRYPITTVALALATLLHLLVWLDKHTTFAAIVVVVHIVLTAIMATLTWKNRR